MLKDVLVNLSVAEGRHPACDYAISLANAFNAYLEGVAIAYTPAIAGGCEVMLPGWIEEERDKAAERAKAAAAKLKGSALREELSAETRVLNATVAQAPEIFAQIARGFDLSIVQQTIQNNQHMKTRSHLPLCLSQVDQCSSFPTFSGTAFD
jgi:hypothetical protein